MYFEHITLNPTKGARIGIQPSALCQEPSHEDSAGNKEYKKDAITNIVRII